MKYYLVTAYTPYCGEHTDEYLAIPDNESWEDDKWIDVIMDIVFTNANEWWDDDSSDDYDGDFDAYIGECGYDIQEVSKEEYDHYAEPHYSNPTEE